MKLLLSIFLLTGALNGNANTFKWKTGDIILQSNACHLCSLIEAEEKSSYSHMGVLVLHQGKWSVLESWGKVRISSLNEFLLRRKKDTHSLILRTIHIENRLRSEILLNRFAEKFAGLSYDPDFLWHNSDEQGQKLYCSEFVLKFMKPYLLIPMKTKPMHFEINREYWIKYFHGNPPDGMPGISPGDFERSPLFRRVGFL